MTTAIIGTGGIGSVIARQLGAGGETLRLSSADSESAHLLAAQIGPAAVVSVDNRDALQSADAVVLALRFTVLERVIDEIADALTDKVLVVPSNPLSTDAAGNVSRLLPTGQSSGEAVAGWLPARARLAMITSGIGLLSVLAAFYGGEEFIHKGGTSGYSMLMGVTMAVALLCYVVNVWAFDGRGSN